MSFIEVQIQDVFSLIRNGVSIRQSEGQNGIPITRIETIAGGIIDFSRLGYADINEGKYEDYYLKDGDILMSHINSWAHLGKCALIDNISKPIIHGMNLLMLRPDKTKILPAFVKYYFETEKFKSQLHRISNQSVNQSSFSVSKLKTLRLPLPSLYIQKEISETLNKADALRIKDKMLLQKYDELAQSIFYEMFGNPARNEMGWDSVKLRDIIFEGEKIGYGIVQPGDEFPGGVPIIRVGDFENNRINTTNLKRVDPEIDSRYLKTRLNGDEILIACVGSIGKIALVESEQKGHNIVRATARVRVNPKLINRYYLSYFLSDPFIQNYFTQETRTVSQPTLNVKQIEETIIFLPPIKLQNQFELIYLDLMKSRQLSFQQLLDSKRFFDSISSNYFS